MQYISILIYLFLMMNVLGVPFKIIMEEMVEKIFNVVLVDFWMKIKEINDIINILIECAQNILHEILGMIKLSAR